MHTKNSVAFWRTFGCVHGTQTQNECNVYHTKPANLQSFALQNTFHPSSKWLAPKETSTLLSDNTVIPWKTYLSPSGLFSLCTEFHDSFHDTFISVAWSALTAICVCACVYEFAMKEFRNALMTTPVFLSLCCSVSVLSIPCRLIWCHGLRWHFKYTPEFDGRFVQGFEHEAFQRAIIHSTLDSERFYQSFERLGCVVWLAPAPTLLRFDVLSSIY